MLTCITCNKTYSRAPIKQVFICTDYLNYTVCNPVSICFITCPILCTVNALIHSCLLVHTCTSIIIAIYVLHGVHRYSLTTLAVCNEFQMMCV